MEAVHDDPGHRLTARDMLERPKPAVEEFSPLTEMGTPLPSLFCHHMMYVAQRKVLAMMRAVARCQMMPLCAGRTPPETKREAVVIRREPQRSIAQLVEVGDAHGNASQVTVNSRFCFSRRRAGMVCYE